MPIGLNARLTGRLACAVSGSTLVRLIRAAADPDQETPLVLGDDFALRKGACLRTVRLRPRSRQPDAANQITRLVSAWIATKTWEDSGRYLDDHLEELHSLEVMAVLADQT